MKLNNKNRKELKKKMAKALGDKIKTLPAELRSILLDDLITAFENRLAVLKPEQPDLRYYIDKGMKVAIEA